MEGPASVMMMMSVDGILGWMWGMSKDRLEGILTNKEVGRALVQNCVVKDCRFKGEGEANKHKETWRRLM